jgi:hypothetical protein
MSFHWVPFLDAHGVNYVTTGKNVGKGYVAIKCPFCGSSDPSEHMTVSISGTGWKCWRNHEHRGAKPHRLIIALTGMSSSAVNALVGNDSPAIARDFASYVRDQLADRNEVQAPLAEIEMPSAFRKFDDYRNRFTPRLAKPYVSYLKRRGFTPEQVAPYGLMYATRGEWVGRVIFPIRNRSGKLVAFTGRAIGKSTLRYKTSEVDINRVLLFEDQLFAIDGRKPKRMLVVTEGPFDALKVSVLGKEHGIVGTCVFTSSPSPDQTATLRWMTARFDRIVALFDRENEQASFRLAGAIPSVAVKLLSDRFDDPGELARAADLLMTVDDGVSA